MITLDFDLKEFTAQADRIARFNRDQLPFAISNTINGSLFEARNKVVSETFDSAFNMRNKRFPAAAMRVEKATKTKPSGSLYDRLDRASLGLHAKGGLKSPKSGRLAIPTKVVKRTKTRGVAKKDRPRNLKGKNIRVTKNAIYRGQGGKLVKLYTLTKSAKLKKRFSFYEDFEQTVTTHINREFPKNFLKALRTAR